MCLKEKEKHVNSNFCNKLLNKLLSKYFPVSKKELIWLLSQGFPWTVADRCNYPKYMLRYNMYVCVYVCVFYFDLAKV